MADIEVECPGRVDGGWHVFIPIFGRLTTDCTYCAATPLEVFNA